jgi:hypothetical protein
MRISCPKRECNSHKYELYLNLLKPIMLILFQSVVYIVSSQSIFDSENFFELSVICISLFFFSPTPYLSLKNLSLVAYLLEFLFSFAPPLALAASSSSCSMSARTTFSRNVEKSSLTSTRPVCSISLALRTHLPIIYRLFSPNTFYISTSREWSLPE